LKRVRIVRLAAALLDKTKLRVTLDRVETDKLAFNATFDQEQVTSSSTSPVGAKRASGRRRPAQ